MKISLLCFSRFKFLAVWSLRNSEKRKEKKKEDRCWVSAVTHLCHFLKNVLGFPHSVSKTQMGSHILVVNYFIVKHLFVYICLEVNWWLLPSNRSGPFEPIVETQEVFSYDFFQPPRIWTCIVVARTPQCLQVT
jgi:hypothetical protein